MRIPSSAAFTFACLVALAPVASIARPGEWGGSGWNSGYGGGWGDPLLERQARTSRRGGDPREGRVDVSRFVAQDAPAATLGHGAIAVTSPAGGLADGPMSDERGDTLAQSARAPFEAAVVDRLVAVGYDTIHADPTGGQIAEVRVSREVLVPAEVKRSPVSGVAEMGVSNHGSGYGLGINVDMSKPRAALLSTRLDARIKDRASGKVLWEGRAQIATREGDDKWTDGAVAARLAEALFDDFRHPTG